MIKIFDENTEGFFFHSIPGNGVHQRGEESAGCPRGGGGGLGRLGPRGYRLPGRGHQAHGARPFRNRAPFFTHGSALCEEFPLIVAVWRIRVFCPDPYWAFVLNPDRVKIRIH